MSSNIFEKGTNDSNNTKSAFNYNVNNLITQCNESNVDDIAYASHGINIKDGFGYRCNVKTDSKLRIPDQKDLYLERHQQLPPMPNIIQYKGFGDLDTDLENDLRFSSSTRKHKSEDVLAGVTIDRFEKHDSKNNKQNPSKLILPPGIVSVSTRNANYE
jgi:hypothetical protein